jgi:type I restriction enzyme R subunit
MPPESITRKEIVDRRLKEAGWNVADRTQVLEEFLVSSLRAEVRVATPVSPEELKTYGSQEFCDYVLLGKNGKPLAVVEAKRSSKNAELGL